jgi:hypothetical protein
MRSELALARPAEPGPRQFGATEASVLVDFLEFTLFKFVKFEFF